MSKEKVMGIIDELAMSQGFYGRLANNLRNLESRGISTKRFFDQFKDCQSAVDVIITIEG